PEPIPEEKIKRRTIPDDPTPAEPKVEEPTPEPEKPVVEEPVSQPEPETPAIEEPEQTQPEGNVLGAGRNGSVMGAERTPASRVLGAERAHTGDENNLIYWIALMVWSAAALAVYCMKALRKNEEEEENDI
ncbi:MAG: hypothetical protein J6M46_07800, partial [Lachnospiraceae bacterium]|nr:hypothetical protein [Lachnospiraceae bacterium]